MLFISSALAMFDIHQKQPDNFDFMVQTKAYSQKYLKQLC